MTKQPQPPAIREEERIVGDNNPNVAHSVTGKTLKQEIKSFREKLELIAYRLQFIHAGLSSELSNPEGMFVTGGCSVLGDTVDLLYGAVTEVSEESHLSAYLDDALTTTTGKAD